MGFSVNIQIEASLSLYRF